MDQQNTDPGEIRAMRVALLALVMALRESGALDGRVIDKHWSVLAKTMEKIGDVSAAVELEELRDMINEPMQMDLVQSIIREIKETDSPSRHD